jgi:hypothetical protein
VKQKSIHFLYRTTCSLSGKYYVGIHSTNKLNDGYLGSGKHVNASIAKYGPEYFTREILCFGTRDYVKDLEIAYVNEQLLADPQCMNHALGGQGGRSVALCKSKESHALSHVKASLTRSGRTKENHLGVKTQSLSLTGRSKETHEGYKKISQFRKTLTGEKAPNSKLSDVQKEEICRLDGLNTSPKEIQKLYPFMTISGIKTLIYRNRSKNYARR